MRLEQKPLISHISAFSLSSTTFYSTILTANLLRIPFYLGYKRYTINITVLSPNIDNTLWVASIILYSSLTVIYKLKVLHDKRGWATLALYGFVLASATYCILSGFSGYGLLALLAASLSFIILSALTKGINLALSLFYGTLLLSIIEFAALICWILHIPCPSQFINDSSWHTCQLEIQLINILYPALPVLLLAFAYSWIGEFTFKGMLGEKRGEKEKESMPNLNVQRASYIIGFLSALLLASTAYYNFLASKNYGEGFPGVDIPHYARWLEDMMNRSSPLEALSYASHNDRFLYLILQYLCFMPCSSIPPETFIAYFMPAILALLLMLSTLLLVKHEKGVFHGSLSMITSILSFQVTVGLFAGFLANWLALSFVYAFYAFFLKTLRMRRIDSSFLLAALLSTAVIYTHPWTWILLVVMILIAYMVTTLTLIISRKMKLKDHIWDFKSSILLLAINFLMFYIKGLLRIGSGARLGGYMRYQTFRYGIQHVFNLKIYLDRTFNWYVGGFYAYPPIIILGILGVISILNYENRYNRLLLSWLLISSAMAFVDFPWQARFLYLTPFNIYVAFGIIYMAKQLYGICYSRGSVRIAHVIFWLSILLSILMLLNYTIRCITIKQYGVEGLAALP